MELSIESDDDPVAAEPIQADLPIWHALRPEVRSTGLTWSDLKLLADQKQLLSTDFVWQPEWESWRRAGDVPSLISFTATEPADRSSARSPTSLKDRAKEELQSYLIISVYIWSIITLLRLHQDLLAETYHFTLQSQGRAVVVALILGKVVLIAEALRLGDGLVSRLPALSVAIRAVLFSAAILAVHVVEEVLTALWTGHTLASTFSDISVETFRQSGLHALIMTIALMPYFLIKEIERQTKQSNLLLLAVGLKR